MANLIKISGGSNASIQGKALFNATPTYNIGRSLSAVNEGSSVTFTLSTTNVANGTVLPYTISGISANDVTTGSLTGNFTVNSGLATTTITMSADQLTEGAETATLTLNNAAASNFVVVNDTSVWTPNLISGLQLWLDAADSSTLFNATAGGSLVTTDGSAVARWNDKSGNNRHAIQTTSNARPILKTVVKNGRNVIRFDGTNDFMKLSSVVESNPSQLTIIAAIKPSSGDCFFAHRSEQTRLIQLAFYVPGTSVDFLLRGSGNQIQSVSSLRFTNNTYYIVNAKFDKTNNSHQLWLNNNTSGANTTNFGTQTFTSTSNWIGASSTNDSTTSSFGGFDLCEAIIYNTALTTTQRQAVETYLNTKWAIY